MEQLEIYAALFCLEYKIKPNEIGMELRVYKYDFSRRIDSGIWSETVVSQCEFRHK